MIFPVPSEPTPSLNRLTKRAGSRAPVEAALQLPAVTKIAALPALRRNFPKPSFSAQLLALGLRYGIDDLVNKADVENPAHAAENAAQRYTLAQDNFFKRGAPALFARFSA